MMDSETHIVVALPHSVRDDHPFHVSLFVTPKVVPSQSGEPLEKAKVFDDWARLVTKAEFELSDHDGTIDCEPLLDPIDPDLWPKLFGPTTPVIGQDVPQWDGRTWRSFNTTNVATLAKVLHLTTMYAGPTDPVAPSGHPLAKPIARLARIISDNEKGRWDESILTERMDGQLRGVSLEEWSDQPPIIGSDDDPEELLDRMLLELHRARRFYERPESQSAYRDRPDPAAVHAPLPSPEPEFHERIAMVGDHPALLRRLGLVVDLHVSDTKRLAAARFLVGSIVVDGPSTCQTSRVLCTATRDGAHVTVPTTSDWQAGALALGDEGRFIVLDTDTDGSAIKSERYLWAMPRLQKVEGNGDSVDAATPALRASGLTVARTNQALTAKQRLARQTTLQAELSTSKVSTLHTEDVTRGLRVEVWDDTARRWSTLHARLADVVVAGHGTVLDDLPEEGFIQGTAASETPGVDDSPVHVHEAMFGWEGWSLSAPRPGRRIRKATPDEVADTGRDEVVEDTPTDPIDGEAPPHPITITTQVQPGTLPRLRFGRSYAFRAWGVDLAGNTRPHELNPTPVVPSDQVAAALTAATAGQPDLPVEAATLWSPGLRKATHAVIAARDLDVATAPVVAPPPADLVDLVTARLRERRLTLPTATTVGTAGRRVTRRALVDAATAAAVADPAQPLVRDTAVTAPHAVAAVATAHLATMHPLDPSDLPGGRPGGGPGGRPGGAPGLGDLVADAMSTITRLRPFLRWDPVQPPAVVPQRRFTEGESVRVLVVRSGVTQDPDTLEVTVTPPSDYADQAPAERGYAATSDRHLAPPKTTQMTAELHGEFDPGIGTTVAKAKAMLGWAITEDGTFFDLDRADIDHPPDRLDQPGVRLEHSAETPQAELKTLPLVPGEPPAPGQYVVHDTPHMAIPYLPDPMSRGVSFVFPEAGRDRSIPFPFGGEGFTAAWHGDWPRIGTYRLVLAGDDELNAQVGEETIEFRLPPGDLQRARMSSSLDRDDLDLLGTWASFPPLVTDDADVVEAAADGWLWGLTPSDEVLLVHAVPRPIEAPRPTRILPGRLAGATEVAYIGAVDVHGPSTDSLVAEASWVDPVDDLTLDRWQEQAGTAIAFQTPIEPGEDIALLALKDQEVAVPGFPGLRTHRAIQQFGDTKHRNVTFRFRALTRFREYFHPSLLAPAFPGDDGQSVVSDTIEVDVPSSARPSAPIVHSVIPLFRWDFGEEPEQPMARRHARRAGVRVYLERPWFSSGEGELLAVLLADPKVGDDFDPRQVDDSGFPFVSKVGQDAVWFSAPVPTRPMAFLALDNLLHATGLDDSVTPGRPVAPPEVLELGTVAGSPDVVAVGYQPQFSQARGMWYVDVALDPGPTFWPFVRLAVARYQPSSVAGQHLSAPVRCDFVQLPPERMVSVSRTDESHVRVVVSGTVGLRTRPPTTNNPPLPSLVTAINRNRTVVARLQRRDPLLDSDLGWETVASRTLAIRGTGANLSEAAWVGELDAGEQVDLRSPRDAGPVIGGGGDDGGGGGDDGAGGDGAGDGDWRVTVEEWEMLPGDVPAPREGGTIGRPRPVWERRLVFADEVAL